MEKIWRNNVEIVAIKKLIIYTGNFYVKINCGQNMKNRCEGREAFGMGLKCVLKYNRTFLIYILDRIKPPSLGKLRRARQDYLD
jgi:hypothetical protein